MTESTNKKSNANKKSKLEQTCHECEEMFELTYRGLTIFYSQITVVLDV